LCKHKIVRKKIRVPDRYLRFFGAGAAITEATTAKNNALTISNDFAIFVWLEVFKFCENKKI